MKSILITGGSGAVGKLIIPYLKKKYEIDNYDKINGDDIFDNEKLATRLKNKYAVIHLAAIPHPGEGPEEIYKRINYKGSINTFEIAKKQGIKKFIFMSSGCVYGFWHAKAKPDKFPIDEANYKPSLDEGQTYYGFYKLKFEEYLKNNSENNGIKSISFRLELPGIMTLYPDHFFTTISVKNLNHAMELAIEKEIANNFEAFNIANPQIPKYVDVQKWCKETWPEIPIKIKGNETLYDINKVKQLLGYSPENPYNLKYYLEYYLKVFGSSHLYLSVLIIFIIGFVSGIIMLKIFELFLK